MKRLSWSCVKCGRCCRDFKIDLYEEDIARILSLGYLPEDFLEKASTGYLLKIGPKGCFFLKDDNTCVIQEKHGFDFKSSACKKFPSIGHPCGELKIVNDQARSERNQRIYLHKNTILTQEVLRELYKNLTAENLGIFIPEFMDYLDKKKSGMDVFRKEDISQFMEEYKKSERSKSSFNNQIEFAKIFFDKTPTPRLYAHRLLIRKGTVTLHFPFRKVSFDYKNLLGIELPDVTLSEFLKLFSQDANIAPKNLIDHAFILDYLPDISRAICKDGTCVRTEDLLEAYVHLSSIFKFKGFREK